MNDATDTITLDIVSLSHDGRGIARLAPDHGQNGGAVVFVSDALPGQRVLARITRRKSNLIEAETRALLRAAPDAAAPICPHHADCGGCPLQTMPYAQQLYWKRSLALDALSRIGRFDREQLEALLGPVAASPALTRFRNKMEFAFGCNGDAAGALTLGMRRRNGRTVVAVPGCALMPPEALRMVDMISGLAAETGFAAYTPPDARQNLARNATRGFDRRRRQGRCAAHPYYTADAQSADPGFWRFLVLRRGLAADLRTPRWWALCITSPGDATRRAAVRALGREVLAAFPQLAAFIHEERATPDALAFGEKRVQTLDAAGRENTRASRLFLPLNGTFFALDAASFFQVNTAGAQVLASAAQRLLGQLPGAAKTCRGLLDLYCGVGAPGLLLAAEYAALLGLEQDAKAVQLARTNALSNGMRHCRYEAGDAAVRLERLAARSPEDLWNDDDACEGANAPMATDALVDPPRAGLSPQALEALLALAPERLLYISCNPATLARDAALLRTRYQLERLAAVDLFPHTPHLECLSLWRRV